MVNDTSFNKKYNFRKTEKLRFLQICYLEKLTPNLIQNYELF